MSLISEDHTFLMFLVFQGELWRCWPSLTQSNQKPIWPSTPWRKWGWMWCCLRETTGRQQKQSPNRYRKRHRLRKSRQQLCWLGRKRLSPVWDYEHMLSQWTLSYILLWMMYWVLSDVLSTDYFTLKIYWVVLLMRIIFQELWLGRCADTLSISVDGC